jgi:hypothetical protein
MDSVKSAIEKDPYAKAKNDIYLYGRYCDYYNQSRAITASERQKEALKKCARYYGFLVKQIPDLKKIIKKRLEVLEKYQKGELK